MTKAQRPLSPHLQVYRWQITMILSTFHRGTGVMLSLGLLILVYWLLAIAGGLDHYEQARAFLGSDWFKLPLVGWTFCFFFHLCNGIRHLAWDTGRGLEIHQYHASGWAVIVVTLIATMGYGILVIF